LIVSFKYIEIQIRNGDTINNKYIEKYMLKITPKNTLTKEKNQLKSDSYKQGCFLNL